MRKKQSKPSGLHTGDQVKMIRCLEADNPKYKDRVWTVKSEPYMMCSSEVVMLEGFSGCFATEFLQKVS